jgi:phosphatidylserine/phosphatidylglycerophosphate/cardiolipin synthase-like enzyme
MVVGAPYFVECKKGCEDCARKKDWKIAALRAHCQYFMNHGIEVSVRDKFHMKGIAFSDEMVITGGFNLTDSTFDDISIAQYSTSIYNAIRRVVQNRN